jgi:hypothetical protein|nr:MAG TPA: hypothetical protein [Caudoviricetes sp.]
MDNLPALADMSKTLFEYVKTVNNNEVVTFVGTLMGISGYSLRDFIGKIQISNLIDKIKDHFKEKEEITEKQEKILRDCFLELEDYIKNCEELDENVFEHISNVLINGIDNEDILTREYIKILKKLSWFDLLILISLGKEYITERNRGEEISYNQSAILKISVDKAQEKNINYPVELIQTSIKKLSELELLNNSGKFEDKKFEKVLETTSFNRICEYSWKCYFLGKLGRNIVGLLNTSN